MFTCCHRRCCLCLKQCGVNIEAAHIIDEAAGGSNDFDNGIPLCFDCHQEVGSYNDKHPRGNKIRPEELRARRDEVYKWVAEGKFAIETRDTDSAQRHPNPLHRIIDLLSSYHSAFGRLHQASTNEARLKALDEWRACHLAVWDGTNVRDDAIRRLADPAKEWLTQTNCPHVNIDDFDRVEGCVHVLSEFAVSPSPMAMPNIYSKMYSTEEELQNRWDEQGDCYMALGGLIARLRELSARAGQKWNPASSV